MKRDDFSMRIEEIRELATNHSKPELARMVRMGTLLPQEALMAGMMIDRIVQSAIKPPQTTVIEDILSPQPPTTAQGQMPEGIMAAAGAPAPSEGVAALPSGIKEMAGGGIVAFAEGGQPQPTYLPKNTDIEKGEVPVYRAKAPEQIDLTKAAEMRKESERLAGLSPNLYEDLRKDVIADKEDFAKQRDQAQGMALLQFGFGLMGARRGEEFQTASAAAQQALSSYGSSLKEIKTSEKEMKKSLRDLKIAEAAYKKSNADKDLSRVEEAKKQLQANEENYVRALNDGVKNKVDLFKTKTQQDTQIRTAEIGANAQITSQKIAAGAPGAEQKLLATIHAEEVAKNPENPPTLAETYERMRTTAGKAEARAKYALALEKEWNDLGIMQSKYMQDNPKIKSGDDYIKAKMKLFDQYYGRPGAEPTGDGVVGVVVQTPQGAIKFNTEEEADAYRQRVGLK